MTLFAVQFANVAGEEARQVLNEIDFSAGYDSITKDLPRPKIPDLPQAFLKLRSPISWITWSAKSFIYFS